MSDGPKTTWRCPECGHEWWNKVTAGAEFIINMEPLSSPCGHLPAPVLVALDDLRVGPDAEATRTQA